MESGFIRPASIKVRKGAFGDRFRWYYFFLSQNPFLPHLGHFTTLLPLKWKQTENWYHLGLNSVLHSGQTYVLRIKTIYEITNMSKMGRTIRYHGTSMVSPNQFALQEQSITEYINNIMENKAFFISFAFRLLFYFSFPVVNTLYRKGPRMQEKFLKIICWDYYSIKAFVFQVKYSANAECEIMCWRTLWNIAPVGRNVKWNLPPHICEANISLRSYFTWQSQISLAKGEFRWKKTKSNSTWSFFCVWWPF